MPEDARAALRRPPARHMVKRDVVQPKPFSSIL
jgi:hypothetical protein